MFKNDINQQLDVTLTQEDNILVILFTIQKDQEFVIENVLGEKKMTFVFIDEKREVDERYIHFETISGGKTKLTVK
jgi:hypothetical protein